MHLIYVYLDRKLDAADIEPASTGTAADFNPACTGIRCMIVTVFRSRLNPGAQEEYGPMAKRMSGLAQNIPGYISHKGFVAEDGERVTIVEFESEEALREWRIHPEHAKAKRRGIESLFSDYKFQICSVIRDRAWPTKAKPGASV